MHCVKLLLKISKKMYCFYASLSDPLKKTQSCLKRWSLTKGNREVVIQRFHCILCSNWATPEFQLDSYLNQTALSEAISEIRQVRGDTNTAAAIAYVRETGFSTESGARTDVPHIAIVLTGLWLGEHWHSLSLVVLLLFLKIKNMFIFFLHFYILGWRGHSKPSTEHITNNNVITSLWRQNDIILR